MPYLLASILALPLPQVGSLPNTESHTNCVLSVQSEKLWKLEILMSIEVSPSNNLEVAIGADTDMDGDLSLEEADFTFGCDCGNWFVAETNSGDITSESIADKGLVNRVWTINRRQYNPCWNLVKIIRRGIENSSESLEISEENRRFSIHLR